MPLLSWGLVSLNRFENVLRDGVCAFVLTFEVRDFLKDKSEALVEMVADSRPVRTLVK